MQQGPTLDPKEIIKPLEVASQGFIPNFALNTQEFNQLSSALAKFNPRVNPDIRTNRSGDRQIKLNARNADNVRQFLISDIFRKELEQPVQKDTAQHISRKAQELIQQFRQNPRTVKNLQGLRNATRPYFRSEEIIKPLEVASQGFIPNFISKSLATKKPAQPRNLDLSWISSIGGSGASELRRIYKDIEQSAKAGKPYTQIDAGFVVGPRIPKILVEGQKLLNTSRARGKDIPKMRLNGMMTPADITKYIYQNKEKSEAGDRFTTRADYIPGEEKEVEKYLKIMGLNPSSFNSVDLGDIKMFKNGFAAGYIPNFANELQDAIEREKSALKSQGSSAGVYVDQDNRLKGSKNPMGLLVANRRDEPSRGSQGVNRAISMGMDPKERYGRRLYSKFYFWS